MTQNVESTDFTSHENVAADAPWHNWAGNIEAVPAYTITARDENDVVAAVKYAAANDLKARVVGTGHSWTGLGETDGVLIDVRNLRSFRVRDRDAKRVVVGAGISIFDACEALWAEGFSLKNQGDIDVQTIAGAASTGTHGSGITLQNIAASIRRIRLVDGTGTVREITEDDSELLNAARVALGTFGVFVEIELEVTDAYYLQEEVTFPTWDEMVADWDDDIANNLHASMFWFPRQDSPALYDIEVPNQNMVDVAHRRRINKVDGPASQTDAYNRVDRNYLIYHGTFTGPYFELEYFVPADRSLEVMHRLRDTYLNEFPDESFPVQPRWIKADDAYLSPCYGRDSVGISISGNSSTDYIRFLRAIHDLFAEFDARPHWGKFHFFTHDDARKVFPKFDEFNKVRAEFDPYGIFLNKQTGELFA